MAKLRLSRSERILPDFRLGFHPALHREGSHAAPSRPCPSSGSFPLPQWVAQPIVEAFPGDRPLPRYLIRDRDGKYGDYFRRRVRNMGIREIITSRKAPWQNPYVERAIGSIRRECLDHVIVLGEAHLRRVLKAYVEYYNESRPHLSLHRNAPVPRKMEPPSQGRVIAIPQVGGLHHLYQRAA